MFFFFDSIDHHLGNECASGMSVGDYLDYINWYRKPHFNSWQDQSLPGRLDDKHGGSEMISSVCAFLYLFFLNMNSIWPPLLSSSHCDFITVLNNLELWDKETLFSKHWFSQSISSQQLERKWRWWKQQTTVSKCPETLPSFHPCLALTGGLVPSITASCYTMYSWYPSLNCSFLKGNGGTTDLEESGAGTESNGQRRGCGQDV